MTKLKLVKDNIYVLKPSATLVINEHINSLVSKGKTVYKLGFGQSPFPFPKSVVKALQKNAHQKDYLPVRGLYALRESVANYHHRKFGTKCSAEDIMIGPGSKELLFIVQMVLQGELLLPSPGWVSYEPQAQLSNKRIHWLETEEENGFMLTSKILDDHCFNHPKTPRILILNYPSNPTGRSLSSTELINIAETARKHEIIILSDEIYSDIHHTGSHVSIANYYPEGTIISSGLSKWCGAGGWGLGTFVFPKELRWLLEKMTVVASETFTSTSTPIQYAGITAYKGGEEIEEYLRRSRLILRTVAKGSSTLLSSYDIHHPIPQGGFYLMPDFRNYKNTLNSIGIYTSDQLCRKLLEDTGVALLPLSSFGMSEDFLGARLSFVDFDGEKALHIIKQNSANRIEDIAPKVVKGIQLLGNWLKR